MGTTAVKDKITLLALCGIEGVSWYLIAREAMRPDGLQRLCKADLTENSKEATQSRRGLLSALPQLDKLRSESERRVLPVLKSGIRLTTVLDPDYPQNLRTIFNRPPFLFYRGRFRKDDARSVAVVGTRNSTIAGEKRARRMAGLLADRGVTVLSGLARGIDTVAHRAALDHRGRTIAVLGSGILRIYPRENENLAMEISERGVVLSQFWPEAPPARHTFPRRNITMSGLGQGTVVVEASATSGAKMQARLALEHGKRVFLLESLVRQHLWAKNYLKRPGACKVSKVEDILTHLRSPDEIRASSIQVDQLSLALS